MSSPPGASRKAFLLSLLALALVYAGFAGLRIHLAFADPNFTPASAEGLLRSDPGLVYYLTERIIDGGGLPPDDFRADPRVQHPGLADLPAMFTVCQEFPVAWAYLSTGGDVPLHVVATWVMGFFSALIVVGIWGLAWELTRRPELALIAVLLYVTQPWAYRTVGVIFLREDFSLPCFALHLWLLARATRVRSAASFLLAALPLVLALSSWHAMGFVVALEAAAFFAWFARTGENPFGCPRAWILPATVAAASLVVPVLRSKSFLFSLAMQITFGLLLAAFLERRLDLARRARPQVLRLGIALGGALAVLLVSAAFARWSGGGQGDYGHVFSFLMAKVAYLGKLPADPNAIPFGARILWQGPFETATAQDFTVGIPVSSLIVVLAVAATLPSWIRGTGERGSMVLTAFVVLSVAVGWLIRRTLVLTGILAPPLGVVLAARAKSGLTTLLVVATAGQAIFFVTIIQRHYIDWYYPPARNAEIAHLVRWSKANLPSEAAVLSDFVISTALLAHNRNPIVCQPKYETTESRRRFEEFIMAYLHGTPEDLRAVAQKYECEYVLIDRVSLWSEHRYAGGIPHDQEAPDEGTAADVFSTTDLEELRNVPGYELVYRSPLELRRDSFRLYKVR